MSASDVRRLFASPTGRLAAQLVGAALLVTLDLSVDYKRQSHLGQGLLDLPAHALTAMILLSALRCRVNTPFWRSAVAWSVLIDLDHIPGLLGSSIITAGEPRPYTHSLLCIAVLWLCSLRLRGRGRQLLFGASMGIVLHLVRDVTDGGAIPFFWPVVTRAVALPYGFYVLTLVLFPIIGLWAEPGEPNRAGEAIASDASVSDAAS